MQETLRRPTPDDGLGIVTRTELTPDGRRLHHLAMPSWPYLTSFSHQLIFEESFTKNVVKRRDAIYIRLVEGTAEYAIIEDFIDHRVYMCQLTAVHDPDYVIPQSPH